MAKSKTKTLSKPGKSAKGLGRFHFLSFKSLMAVAVATVFAAAGLMYTNNGFAASCRVYPVSATSSDPGPYVTVPSWSTCRDVNIGRSALRDSSGSSYLCASFRVRFASGGTGTWQQVCKGSGLQPIFRGITNGKKYRVEVSTSQRLWFNVYD